MPVEVRGWISPTLRRLSLYLLRNLRLTRQNGHLSFGKGVPKWASIGHRTRISKDFPDARHSDMPGWLSALGTARYIPPAEAEANYYRQLRNAADVPALS